MDFGSDEKLKLLTDALRAGPGSPEWRAAVAEFRENGSVEDEHSLLLRVREHLASGRSYRAVRAGPAFTRKVIEGIEAEEQAQAGVTPNANWIAAIAALVIVAVVAVVAFLVWPHGGENIGAPSLERTNFVVTAESVSFEDSIGADWQTFGNLTLMADHGLRPIVSGEGSGYRGGGVYWDRQLPADEPISVEATVTVQKGTGDAAVQLFVTDDLNFTGGAATTAHELVWLLKDQEAKVFLPDGSVQGQTVRLKDVKQTVDVRVALGKTDAVVEVNQQKLWAGPHQLDGSKARRIGFRFVVAGKDPGEKISLQSARVMETEKGERSLGGASK
jgi:hypothetical protein